MSVEDYYSQIRRRGNFNRPEPTTFCTCCGEPCEEGYIDESFDYEYGSISATHHQGYMGSDCCEAETAEGYLYINRYSMVQARKDYPDEEIEKGDIYCSVLLRGYYYCDPCKQHPHGTVQFNHYKRLPLDESYQAIIRRDRAEQKAKRERAKHDTYDA